MNLIILQSDMVLVDCMPFLYLELFRSCTQLCRRQFLEVADSVIFIALDADLLAQSVIQNDLDHCFIMWW